MDVNELSGLKLYSLGIVTENKAIGKDEIQVTPIEEFSFEQGKIVPDTRKHTSNLPDTRGVVKKADIKGSAILTAKWIPFGNANRDTAPDVCKSETVLIFRYADTQKYYWDTIFREPMLRRKEHVRYSFSNKPDGIDPYDGSSSYWVEYSTVGQYIHLHTSDNDGEPCTYDVKIDAKAGNLSIQDNLGNSLQLNSAAGHLQAQTNTSVYFKTPLFYVDSPNIVLKGKVQMVESIQEKISKALNFIREPAKPPSYKG